MRIRLDGRHEEMALELAEKEGISVGEWVRRRVGDGKEHHHLTCYRCSGAVLDCNGFGSCEWREHP